MKISQLFVSDVTRDIAPVVYFHERSPEKLQDEVSEYIVTGGFPDGHPHHRRVPNGIHEQYVRLLGAILQELESPGGPDLPASWISGFYGSGKSSFAKLLGYALDGVELPDGKSLAEALLARDTSPRGQEFRDIWAELRAKVDPIAVVFDIGGVARDNEHIHSAVVRQVQKRLGYCSTQPLVAEAELKLERDGQWEEFETQAQEALGKPWSEVKDMAMAEEDFSLVMSRLFPDRYGDPMAWFMSWAGTATPTTSAEEATGAIKDMLRFREPGKTLFLIVDEVSQYIHQDQQRMLKLQSFVSELGQRLKGRAWLLVTGQQKLEEADDEHVLGKLKDRFKPKLRVHLDPSNIRDVVHKRLLEKTPEAEAELRALFERHRNDLTLYAYECRGITADDFVEVYPMLPGHIDLLLDITTALRTRSTRSQGDDQAIRGLLQLLGELFRAQRLAEMEVGSLVTLDRIYEVQRSALDSDVQNTMARIQSYCAEHGRPLCWRAARAVALLELIQEKEPTDVALIARCLYDRLNLGKHDDAVRDALEELKRENLLGYSEKQGYKIQSSAGEEWERERSEFGVSLDEIGTSVQEALKYLVNVPSRPELKSRGFPWLAYFGDRRGGESILVDSRDPANVTVDLRMVSASERDPAAWVNRSAEDRYRDRIFWVAGDTSDLESEARKYGKSQAMVRRYGPRRESLLPARQRLLLDEVARVEDLQRSVQTAVESAWLAGDVYFRGRAYPAREFGATFGSALKGSSERLLPDLYPSLQTTQVSPTELQQLLEPQLNAPSPKFVDELGILSVDAGRYVPECAGTVPQRIFQYIEREPGVSGQTLLQQFGGPPFGYQPNVVRACVAGLLRGSKIEIQPEDGELITSKRDAGARDLFDKERGFKKASFHPHTGAIDGRDRNVICRFFEDRVGKKLERENDAIADAVSETFPALSERLRGVLARLDRMPAGDRDLAPGEFLRLEQALSDSYRQVRRTDETVKAVKRHLEALNDGVAKLAVYEAELTDEALAQVRDCDDVARHQLAQLERAKLLPADLVDAAVRVRAQLDSLRPWRDMAGVAADVEAIRAAYLEAREQILQDLGDQEEQLRTRIQSRMGYATLSAEKCQHVVRPVQEAIPSTAPEAVAPSLEALRGDGRQALQRAEEEANERLDQILSEQDESSVRKVSLDLRHREIGSKEELRELLDDVRGRIEPELERGHRVRLV